MQNNTFPTLFVGHNLIRLSSVGSTNDFLKMMLSNSEPLLEGTVIMADNQFAGRGQYSSSWQSEPGSNLTFSIFLKPGFVPLEKQFLLNMAVCVGINEVLCKLTPSGFSVKWPNDVYYQDRKVGGVLIENGVSERIISYSIVGIGINVNQQNFDGPGLAKAVSIGKILQQHVDLQDLLRQICGGIEAEYLKLKAGRQQDLHERYLSILYRRGITAQYEDKTGAFDGEITRVDERGVMFVKREGKDYEYRVKEIEFLP
ncbi:biotin--[acetyl-CoA-carboxylase] ligase [Pedobacter deserti]|uniref:biotin--[acetyl-CoA-carboxylase] ligase n=1 Tax=Pedobacter deserti TaxID=2817382 RepID=UPI0021097AE1|nr:biotin--[acetyl-CoA-carboxylase] ligase [Pedobacter sp. SYSU D00382]